MRKKMSREQQEPIQRGIFGARKHPDVTQFASQGTNPPVLSRPFSIFKASSDDVRHRAGTITTDPTEAKDDDRVASKISSTPDKDLEQIVRKQALNDQDRFDILDARDKLMKLRGIHKRQTVLTGTCPDLCPEKERYSRLVKNQLRIYEMLNGTIHHKATVKEYSRSSADQDVPLPHELRPPDVLNRTMDHILWNVMDRVENLGESISHWYKKVVGFTDVNQVPSDIKAEHENTGDWFEFIWNSTRAIRKDITQQQLTDLTSVSLVEKCARFHIICSGRLVEEDSNNFSKKLNDENLTKCLQSLKHMYEDLRDVDQRCPNEPEFRSYEILMNLNNPDVLRSILKLDAWVRKSSDVKLAIQFFMALNSNNYVRFFKLVHQATLLQSCILIRYFYQVRKKALETLTTGTSYSYKSTIAIGLRKLTLLLAFEDERECQIFCKSHGFTVDSEAVILCRSLFRDPESVPETRRAVKLVESKRAKPWSAVVNGGQLAANPYIAYRPYDSFDTNGYLKPEALHYEGQEILSGRPFAQRDVREDYPRSFEIDIDDMVRDLLEQSISRIVFEVCSETVDWMHCLNSVADEQLLSEIDLAIADYAKDAMTDVRESMEKSERDSAIIRDKSCRMLCEDLISEETTRMLQNIAAEELHAFRDRRKEGMSVITLDELVKEFLTDFLSQISDETMKELINERKRNLEDFCHKRSLRIMRRTFSYWRKIVTYRKKKLLLLEHFPPGPNPAEISKQLDMLGPRFVRKSFSSKELQSSTNSLFQVIDLHERLLHEIALQPLDLIDIITRDRAPLDESLNWKLLLCLPSVESHSPARPLVELLKLKFTARERRMVLAEDDTLLSCYTKMMHTHRVSVCTRCIDDEVLDEQIVVNEKRRRSILMGASALLFVVLPEVESMQKAKERLHKIILRLFRLPPIPCVILYASALTHSEKNLLELRKLEDSGVISFLEVASFPKSIFDQKLVPRLIKAASDLALKSAAFDATSLMIRPIRELVEDLLLAHVLPEFYKAHTRRSEKGLPESEPEELISLFNYSIDFLVRVCLNPELRSISWPVPEFEDSVQDNVPPTYWNDEQYLDVVRQRLNDSKLPSFPSFAESFSWQRTFHEVKHTIDNYLDLIQRPSVDMRSTSDRITKSLCKSQRAFNRRAQIDMDEACLLIKWTDIVHACIDYKTNLVQTVDPFSSAGRQMIVVVLKRDFESFKVSRSWRSNHSWAHEETLRRDLSDSFTDQVDSSYMKRHDEMLSQVFEERKQSEAFLAKLKQLAPSRKAEEVSFVEDKTDLFAAKPSRKVHTVSLLSPTLGQLSCFRGTTMSLGSTEDTNRSPLKRKSSLQSTMNSQAKSPRPEKTLHHC